MEKTNGPILIEDLDAVVAGAQMVAEPVAAPTVKLHRPFRPRSMLETSVQQAGNHSRGSTERSDW